MNNPAINQSLTIEKQAGYASPALAKSNASFSRLKSTSAQALNRSAFFVPALWWALWERLRMRRLSLNGTANPATSATLLFSSKGGSSRTLNEGLCHE